MPATFFSSSAVNLACAAINDLHTCAYSANYLAIEGGRKPDFIFAYLFGDLVERETFPRLGFKKLADNRGELIEGSSVGRQGLPSLQCAEFIM